MVVGWNPFIYLFILIFLKHRFHILHFPNLTGLFTKPTGRHYTKYPFSPDIVIDNVIFMLWIESSNSLSSYISFLEVWKNIFA